MNQDGDRIYALVPRLIRHLAYKKSFAVPCGGLEQTVREESARVTLDYDIPVTASETAGKLVKVWKKNVRGASASQYDIRDMIPYTDIETDCVVYGQDTLACVLELDAGRADEKHTLALEAVKSVLADGAPGNVLSLVFFGAARAGEESAPSLYLVLYGADKKALRARAGEAQTLLRNGGFGCAILKDRDLARFMRRNYSHPFDKTLNAVPERDLYAWSLPWSMRIFRNRLKIEDTAVSCYRVARYPAAAWDEALFSLPGVKVVMQIHAVAETASRRRARREMDGGFIEKTGQAPPLLTDIADGVEKVADVNTYVSAYYPAFPDKKRGIQSAVPQLDRLRAEGFELDPLYLQQFDAYVGAGITKGDPLRHKAMGVPLGTIADMITLACAARRRAENGSAELTHR
jgi:hypothetical protein